MKSQGNKTKNLKKMKEFTQWSSNNGFGELHLRQASGILLHALLRLFLGTFAFDFTGKLEDLFFFPKFVIQFYLFINFY